MEDPAYFLEFSNQLKQLNCQILKKPFNGNEPYTNIEVIY